MGYADVILGQPPKGGWLSFKNSIGHRYVFFGTQSIEEQPDNMNPGKTRLVATCDCVDLDDGQGGVIQWGALVDTPGIVNKLKNQRNAIMGRIVLGEAKAGQSPPVILALHVPADAEYSTTVWLPANRAALAGRGPQAPAAAPSAPTPAPAPSAQQYVNAPAATAAFPGQVLPAPQPVAAAAQQQTLPMGDAGGVSPEALAAVQRMIASGQLPGFPGA